MTIISSEEVKNAQEEEIYVKVARYALRLLNNIYLF